MNDRKYSKLMRTGVVLTGISVGLFTYQNFIYPTYIEPKDLCTVYVASRDLKIGSEIKRNMFNKKEIKKSEVIDGMITDISEVEGNYLKGTLFKGEVLSESRLDKAEVDDSQVYTIQFKSEVLTDVKKGDYIAVYVKMLSDDNKVVIRELFPRKKVYGPTSIATTTEEGGGGIYITVSEQEMKDYYIAEDKGTIIGAKITSNDDTKASIQKFNPDEDVVNSTPENMSKNENTVDSTNKQDEEVEVPDNGEAGLIEYEVQSGDTLETIVTKFKTNEEKIKELNNNKTVFTVGQTIYVPSR